MTKLYDPEALDRADGTFTLYLPLPEQVTQTTNPNGSRPEGSLIIESNGSLRDSLSLMKKLGLDHDEQVNMAYGFAGDSAPVDLIKDWNNPSEEELAAVLKYEHVPFITMELVTASVDDTIIKLSVNAPSGIAALYIINELCTEKYINGLATNAMPDLDEDEW